MKVILKLNAKYFIYIFILSLNIFSGMGWAINSIGEIPKKVYRSTPSKPDKVFVQGFQRSQEEHVDLARHINGESLDPSGFISTTSNRQYAYDYAISYAMGWWHVNEFYVYEIIPDSNFISVRDTYLRTIENQTSSITRMELEAVQHTFTREEEYSALYSIPPERVISATRFEYDSNERNFIERERIINTITRTNENIPQLQASIHPNNYPLGTYNGRQFTYNGISVGFACISSNTAFMRKKRNINESDVKCPSIEKQTYEFIKKPDILLEKKSFKIEVNFEGYNYCLTTYKNYVYLDYNCKIPQKWNYTEFGQIITEVNDGENAQYYCMTAPSENSIEDYAKMQICDLNNYGQIWKIKRFENRKFILLSKDNFVLSYAKKYAYLKKHKENEDKLYLTNKNDFQNKKSDALIQFSVDPLKTFNNYVLYPTTHSNAYIDNQSSLSSYTNYYNAHNNALFSSYGHEKVGPQTCYFSSLLRNGGSSWEWVKNDYCSTKGNLNKEFRWLFKKTKTNRNLYTIHDISNNTLRIDNIVGSQNRYFAYTAYKYWYDSNSFVNSFNLSAISKIYADAFSSSKLFNPTQEQRLSFAFASVKEKYREKINLLLN